MVNHFMNIKETRPKIIGTDKSFLKGKCDVAYLT